MSPVKTPLLDRVRYPADLRNFSAEQLRELADELRAEIIKRLTALSEAGVLDLTAVPVPEDGIGNRPLPSVDQSDMNGK